MGGDGSAVADVEGAPPGHFRSAHQAFGWCSACPGRDVLGELLTWRLLWMRDHGHPDVDLHRYARPMGDPF